MSRQLVYAVGIVLVAVGGIVYTLAVGNEPLLGLDLQGGASVVLEPSTPADDEALDQAVEIIRNRVDGLGVAEPEISRQGANILVQLPGVDDQQRAIDLVGQTAELRFRPVLAEITEIDFQIAATAAGAGGEVDESSQAVLDTFALTPDAQAGDPVVLADYDDDRNIVRRYSLGPTAATGDALESARATFSAVQGWFVSVTFKSGPNGIDLFNQLGATCHSLAPECPTRQIAIEIDNEVVSAPRVQDQQATFVPFSR
ncbi:MAG: preprotein translocase subunit SecD, partial [Acidimicrobiales bacterium]